MLRFLAKNVNFINNDIESVRNHQSCLKLHVNWEYLDYANLQTTVWLANANIIFTGTSIAEALAGIYINLKTVHRPSKLRESLPA